MPPFEKPSIAKAISNFVSYKFGHLPQNDWQMMLDLSKLFLHCLNFWKLETPSSRKQTMSAEDISSYKVRSFEKFFNPASGCFNPVSPLTAESSIMFFSITSY